MERSPGHISYRHQAKPEICESRGQWESCLSKLDIISDITIASRKLWKSLGRPKQQLVSLSPKCACGGSVKLNGKLSCSLTYWNINISTTAYIADSLFNLLTLDWLGQFGLLDLFINIICYTHHFIQSRDDSLVFFRGISARSWSL